MRICVITGLFPVLWETPFLNQITGLVVRGHDLDIYADQPQPGVPPHPDIHRFQLLDRTYYPIGGLAARPFGWTEAFKLIRSHHGSDRATLLRTLNPLIYRKRAITLDQLRRTAPFLPRRAYDICYCPYAQDARKSLRLRKLGVLTGKLVVGLRGSDISRYVAQRGGRVYRRLFRDGDLFLPVCEAFARRIVGFGCSPDKIVVHHTGVNLQRFPFRPREPRNDGPLRLITVGRLVEKKGVEYGLRAVRLLLDGGMDLRYTIVGSGPLKEKLEHEVQSLRLQPWTRLAGWQPHTDVQQELMNSDVMLAPCVTAADGDEEGIPNVLREAMAVGVPVISTLHSGIPELIEDGVTGFLVPERDPVAIANSVGRLVNSVEGWRGVIHAARKKVEEDDIDLLNDRFECLLEALRRGTRPVALRQARWG